jgi:hypothetical protein
MNLSGDNQLVFVESPALQPPNFLEIIKDDFGKTNIFVGTCTVGTPSGVHVALL